MSGRPSIDELWAVANEALDERRDPLDDPRVRAACEAHPAEAAHLARLVTELARAQALGAAPRLAQRAGRASALAGAAAALACALTLVASTPREPAPRTARGEVLHYRMRLTTEGPHERRVFEDDGARRETRREPRDGAPRAQLAHWTRRRTAE